MEHCQSYRERLSYYRVDNALHFVVFDDLKFFRREVSDFPLVHSFLKVCGFVGPGETYC